MSVTTRSALLLLLAAGSSRCLAAQVPFAPPADAFESIVHQPAQATSFTLDRTMLAATDGFFNGSNPEAKRVAAGLNSITVHNYHYRDYTSYDPSAFAAVDAGYRAAGYQHLVNANNRSSGALTDLWLRFNGTNVNSLVVLTRGDRNMTALVVDCWLRPLDLLHLTGHFGIPKVDQGAIMVPAGPPPNGQPAYNPPSTPPYGGSASHPVNESTYPVPQGGVPYATQPGAPAPAPLQNPPMLKHHSADDPQ